MTRFAWIRRWSQSALLLMATSSILFAGMNVFVRLATRSASWASVGAVRALVGAMVALAVARARGASLAANDKQAIFWRSVFGTAAMMATFFALSSRKLALGDTVTLLNLTPVFLALLAPVVLRERTTTAVALAILTSLGGVVLVLHPSLLADLFGTPASAIGVLPVIAGGNAASPEGPSALLGGGVAVAAAFFASIAMMMLRRAGRTETAEAIAFHFSLFAAAVHAIVAAFDPRIPDLRDAFCMLAAGVCAGVAQIAMTRAYALENAARVSGMSYLSVVASALLGSALFGEQPSPTAMVGMTFIIAGGLALTFARR